MTGLWAHRRRVLSLALCLVTVLFATVVVRTWLSATGPTARPTPNLPTHATYFFQLEGFPLDPLRPGQNITVRWVPHLIDPAASHLAATVFCWLGFYGPYTSQADAKQLVGRLDPLDPASWPTPAFAPDPRTISDQTAEPLSVLLPLPVTLRPGIYVVASTAQNTWDLVSTTRYFFVRLAA